jgi:ABC-type transport system involved in cytochrome bd biosynthesis fused ATPase/permease subunit
VDQHVGNELFRKCIRRYLKKKVVLFATNQLMYLSDCDKIIFLENGTTSGYGTYDELLSSNATFKSLINKYITNSQQNGVKYV